MKKKVIAYPHIHFDREWYREFEEFRLRLIEIFDVIFEEFEKGELEKFFFDGQTSSIEDYLEIHPENLSKIKKLIAEKKLFVGPFYCLSDIFLVNGRCLEKNLELGIKQAKKWGYDGEFFAYLADTFGHSNSIATLLAKFNLDKAIIWRGVGNLPSEFIWNGIKTTNLLQGYFHDEFSQNLSYPQKAELIQKTLNKIAQDSYDTILLPIGADHLCPPRNLKSQIYEINKYLDGYEIEVGTPFDYFKLVENNYKQRVFGEFLDNSKTFILKGSYSCRTYIKQQNAYAQWLLTRFAEPLNSICKGSFEKEIEYAYKLLIQNHAHDSIYGCSTDEVDFEVQSRYKKVNQISKGIIERLLKNSKTLSIANLSDFEYNGEIQIETSKSLPKWLNAQKIGTKRGFLNSKLYNVNEIPITEDFTTIKSYLVDVKSLAPQRFTELTKDYIETNPTLKITPQSLENQYISVNIIDGKINIKDKINNKIYENALCISDRTDLGDSYNFAPKVGEKPKLAEIIGIKIKEKGHIRSILEVLYKLGTNKFKLDIILTNQSKTLNFELNYNNKKKNHLLQVVFNTPQNISKTLSEDTFGEIEREIDVDYNIENFMPAPRGIELKINTFPMQRYVSANGFGLISKGLQEYECHKNALNLTLLRAIGIISNPKNPARGTPAGPPLKYDGMQCLGKNKYEFALTFDVENIKQNADKFYGVTLCKQY
ncbi:hypothetical protein J6Q66_01040 [bacterium]|nr:hypothetical protein [bacterium]